MMDWGPEGRGRLAPLKTAESSVSDVIASPTSTIASSPASSDSDRRFSLYSLKSRARRSISGRESVLPSHSPRSQSSHLRKLSKSRPQSTSSIGPLSHRGSGFSDDSGHFSIGDLSTSTPAPLNIDWQSQKVEGIAPLESDTQFLRTRTPYLVLTSEYLIKLKCRSDAVCLFPWLSDKPAPEVPAPNPDPLLVIPLSAVVSVFAAESTRPSFGIEVWWKAAAGVSFQQASFYFNLPRERDEQMYYITRAVRGTQNDDNDAAQPLPEVVKLLNSIHETEEPSFKDRKIEIFPVVPRASTRKEHIKKSEDSSKKAQETPLFYLVVGTYLCHFVAVQKAKSGEPICQHKSFGLVTLEKFRGDWAIYEERFNIAFRHPFAPRVILELASRFYRRITRVLGVADRYLRPVWPQTWQTAEIFHVTGLKEPQYLVPSEDFGSVRRTLDAYVAAYRCQPVEWEINWKTRYPPEFRVLPAKDGTRYSPLQLLAVLRALRYNDYFNSLSFRDVDLTGLYDTHDRFASARSHLAYLSRTGITLDANEVEILQQSSVLHQEFHALAFCSETIQQVDFSRSPKPRRRGEDRRDPPSNLQFLTPILTLLRSGITKCNHLILVGNPISQSDLEDIVETLEAGKIYTLDVSSCGLCENELRHLTAPFLSRLHPLGSLNLSDNPGRLPASFLPDMLYNLVELRELNLRGSLQADGDISDSLIPYEVLAQLEFLEGLDISGFKLNAATLQDLAAFLRHRLDYSGERSVCRLQRLILDHCGITGSQVAELCQSIGYGSGMLLSVSGNQLEDGVEHLADAIRGNIVPAGLLMELVEFKEEGNYLLLIRALAETKAVSLLSLAGTAPTPFLDTISQPCSSEVIDALESIFRRNESIQFLDLSGFSGKLEDGQLAKGFVRCLVGLSKNTTMTHLRIRNQNLHDDVGIIGQVLRENRALRLLDCQENQLNLSSIKFLVNSAKENDTLVYFPFSTAERGAIWDNILQGLQKTSRTRSDKLKTQEATLRQLLDSQFQDLEGYLRRNRAALEQTAGQLLDFDTSANSLEEMERAWMTMFPIWTTADGERYGPDSDERTSTMVERLHRPTVRSSHIGIETSVLAPYHIRHGDDSPDSPTDTLDPASEISTPAEMAVPEGLVFDKMVHDLRETGLDSV